MVLVVAMAHNLAVRKHEKKILLIGSVGLGPTFSSHSHLMTLTVSDTLLYLPWSDFSSNKTRDIGTIAFSLISTHDDRLSPDSIGLGEAVNETLNLTVWSWIANDTLSGLQIISLRIKSTESVT